MKIAVIGLGFMGSTHLKALKNVPESELVAVVSFLQSQPVFAPEGRFDPQRWAAFASDPARLRAAVAGAREMVAAQKLFVRVGLGWPDLSARLPVDVFERF